MTWSLLIPIVTKHETTNKNTMYVHINDTHMYTHILKYRSGNSFMTESFFFNTQNKSFYERVILIV